MDTVTERIAQLQLKLKKLEEKRDQLIRSAEREQLARLERVRREEIRRKYLIGSVLLERVKTGKIDGAKFFAAMASALKNDADRKLFECSRSDHFS